MSSAINQLTKKMYFEIHNISKIRNLLPTEIAALLVSTLVLSKLDYCNSLLFGVTKEMLNKLQIAQNSAARLVCKKRKRDHVTPILEALHWLPVEKRIMYKILTTCHKSLNGKSPCYLQNLLSIYEPKRSLRSSNEPCRLSVPLTKLKTMGDKAFSFSAPKLWNSLPSHLKEVESLDSFKSKLKTYLFTRSSPL